MDMVSELKYLRTKTWWELHKKCTNGKLFRKHRSKSFETGQMRNRDGVTVIVDPNAFGLARQVLLSDPKLFCHLEGLHYNEK